MRTKSSHFNRSAGAHAPGGPKPKISHGKDISAFSLIEICLALGIIAFALVAIIGLLPTAVNTGQESQRETVTALIARTIFNGLGAKKPFVQKSTESLPEDLDLRTDSKTTVKFDEAGNLAAKSGNEIYAAEISVLRNTPQKNLSRIEIAIRTPAAAARENQKTYLFVTNLNATDPFKQP